MSVLLDIFVRPLLANLGLYYPPDPTYGRYLLGKSPREITLETDKNIQVTSRRVFIDKNLRSSGEEVYLTPSELESARGKEWIYYKVWEKGSGNNCDVVVLHGINDYAGSWAVHIPRLLEKGFRVIAPDLPSHGRSTGLHTYLTSPEQLTDGLEAVLADVDTLSDLRRKLFLVGSSMGGGLARHLNHRTVSGVFAFAPFIGVAPETLPSRFVQISARILRLSAGRLPFATVIRGKVSDDPRVEEEFSDDPRRYFGKLRIATGLTLLMSLTYLTPSVAASFTTPFRIIHGDHDRVTSHIHSVEFYDAAGSVDKQLDLYAGYEHLMLKVGVDEKDDEKRQLALQDMEAWLLQRV